MENKQEKLEEAAEKRYGNDKFLYAQQREGFIAGAKWQEENSNVNALNLEIDALKKQIQVLEYHQEKMYSEEEVNIIAWSAWYESQFQKIENRDEEGFTKWFEQFKKK